MYPNCQKNTRVDDKSHVSPKHTNQSPGCKPSPKRSPNYRMSSGRLVTPPEKLTLAVNCKIKSLILFEQ